MKIAMVQINSTLGDFIYNRKKILNFVLKAHKLNCDLVVFPEASLFGYFPMDLLNRSSVVSAEMQELKVLHQSLPSSIQVLVGVIYPNPGKSGKPYFNSAVLLEKNKDMKVFHKTLTPTYDVFDEGRYFEVGDMRQNIFQMNKRKILVTICEDIWAWPLKGKEKVLYKKNPILDINPDQVDLVLNLSASPFTPSKFFERYQVANFVIDHLQVPLVYVNMVGGQDELIFDGQSFCMNTQGQIIQKAQSFQEDLKEVVLFDKTLNSLEQKKKSLKQTALSRNILTSHLKKNQIEKDQDDLVRKALILGLRDFVSKTDFKKVHLGVSGGVDSALVSCLAVEALGKENVQAYALPGPYSTQESFLLAQKLTSCLDIGLREIPITEIYQQVRKIFLTQENLDKNTINPVCEENFQARLRGLLLMAVSNQKQSLLLNTSNKSELTMGYATLYGDLVGGLCVIGDLLKTQVFCLAEHYCTQGLIPRAIIERKPTAELRPNQKDEDALPAYSELDPLVKKLVEKKQIAVTSMEKEILTSLMKSEFKRWQAPPILKVSSHAFGRGRRFPIAHKAFF